MDQKRQPTFEGFIDGIETTLQVAKDLEDELQKLRETKPGDGTDKPADHPTGTAPVHISTTSNSS